MVYVRKSEEPDNEVPAVGLTNETMAATNWNHVLTTFDVDPARPNLLDLWVGVGKVSR